MTRPEEFPHEGGWALLWRVPLFAPATSVDSWLVVDQSTGELRTLVKAGFGVAGALARDTLQLRALRSALWLRPLESGDAVVAGVHVTGGARAGGRSFFEAPRGPPLARLLAQRAQQRGELDEALALRIAREVLRGLREERATGRPARLAEILIGFDGEVQLVPRLFSAETHGSLPLYAAEELLIAGADDERGPDMHQTRDDLDVVLHVLARAGRIVVERDVASSYESLLDEIDRLEALFGRAHAEHLAGVTRGLFPEDFDRHTQLRETLETLGLSESGLSGAGLSEAGLDVAALLPLEPKKQSLAGREAHLLVERAREDAIVTLRRPLLALTTAEGVHRFAMLGHRIVIGSSPHNDIEIESAAIEPHHLEVQWSGMEFLVQPLGPVFRDADGTQPLLEVTELEVGETLYFAGGIALTFALAQPDEDPDAA